MKHLVVGIFKDTELAGSAIAELKQQGYTNDISIVTKDYGDTAPTVHQIKEDTSDGTVAGATTGGVVGTVTGFLTSVTPVLIPGIGLLIGGPFAMLIGAAGGALAGGFVGALVDVGFPDEKARMFENAVKAGEVLITVSVEETDVPKVYQTLEKHGAREAGDIKIIEEI